MLNFLMQNSLIPKSLYRLAIYLQIKDRLKTEKNSFIATNGENKFELIEDLKKSPIALSTQKANEQHYELPTDFYRLILGPNLKYSCCYYQKNSSLRDAENHMLDLYCKRAMIENGQQILDLGCGWGAFTLYAAKKYPNSHFTAISNSSTQKKHIDDLINKNKLSNVTTRVEDVNSLQLTNCYDRIVSIEMFEHMRNYQLLFGKLSEWLNPKGLLFVHHFCHHYLSYTFDSHNSWMARQFFENGLMPSEDLLLFFNNDMALEKRWRVNGMHYAKTCYDWLDNLYANKKQVLASLACYYEKPRLHYQYWDLFIRSCAQLFSFNSGNEWFVTHCLFRKIHS